MKLAKLAKKLEQLNEVDSKIQFTLETETNGTLPFLDVLIMNHEDGVKYRVYRKKTNREDYIHYFSSHSERVKSGVVIGFFLRAYRICSDEYVANEIEHIFEAFMRLKYPKAFLVRCLRKARKIRQSPTSTRDRSKYKIIIAPSSRKTQAIAKVLKKAGVKLIEKSGLKIGEIIKKEKGPENKDSVVYKVPCGGCSRAYFGETYRGIKKRMNEHKTDIRFHRSTSSFVTHIDKYQHLPDLGKVKVLWSGQERSKRKMVEAAVIESLPNINSKRGDYILAPILARILWAEQIQ